MNNDPHPLLEIFGSGKFGQLWDILTLSHFLRNIQPKVVVLVEFKFFRLLIIFFAVVDESISNCKNKDTIEMLMDWYFSENSFPKLFLCFKTGDLRMFAEYSIIVSNMVAFSVLFRRW